jgi:hypothetical protein
MVRLTQEARQHFSTLISTGRAAAAKRLHARIRLKAEGCEGRRSWTDAEMAVAVDTSEPTGHRVRQAWVAPGWEAAVARQPPTGRP